MYFSGEFYDDLLFDVVLDIGYSRILAGRRALAHEVTSEGSVRTYA